jgi:hypothetical protein
MLLVTIPLGYNQLLDASLLEGAAGFTDYFRLVRVDKENNWVERPWPTSGLAAFAPYGTPFPGANDLLIGIFRRALA